MVGAFPYEYAEKDFAVADWYLRGMAYQRAGKLLLTTCAQLARAGQASYGTRWELTTTREKLKNGNTVVVPVLRMKGKHNADFAAFAASLLG